MTRGGQVVDFAKALERLGLDSMVVDDEAVAAHEAELRRALEYEGKVKREALLQRERVPLTERVERSIVTGGVDLEPRKAVRTVRRWLGGQAVPPVLFLSGGTQCGKSVAAALALVSIGSGLWRSHRQAATAFASSFGDPAADADRMKWARMLVVDDVGLEPESQRGAMGVALVELLEARKRSPRRTRTVITTNLGQAAFFKRYPDPRLRGRMGAEAGISAWVPCGTTEGK